MGSWSAAGVAKQSVSLLQGMRNATEGKATLLYDKGANVTDNKGIQDFLNPRFSPVQTAFRIGVLRIALFRT